MLGAIPLTEGIYHSEFIGRATDDGHSFCLGMPRYNGVWFTYTPNLTGTATVDTCASDFDTMVEVFSADCSNPLPIACNDDSCSVLSEVQFPCFSGETYLVWAGSYTPFNLGNLVIRASCSTVLGNDDCVNAFPLLGKVYHREDTTAAGDDPPPPCLPDGDQGVWFTFSPLLSGPVTIDTCESNFDTILGVYTGSCTSLQAVACNDDFPGCGNGLQSRVDFFGIEGTTYLIYAGGFAGAYGELTIQVNAPVVGWFPVTNGNLILLWPGAYTLDTASSTSGPWSEVTQETGVSTFYKTYEVEMTVPKRFFKAK